MNRKETTAEMYPDRLSIKDFEEIITQHLYAYIENMKRLGSPAVDEKYIEEWIEQYLAWLEIEKE